MNDSDRDISGSSEDLVPPTGSASPEVAPGTTDDDRFECRACGYVYDPNKGDPKNRIIAGTPFTVLPMTWKCPTCGAKKGAFTNVGTTASYGFKENQRYGLGVNTMSPGQKSLLIYGGLGVAIIIFISLYTLN
ncbi:rubredoxin [Chamaesiphon polymorphus]|uniref:Rubredoxin n=1 Tax=Chamaesiphon polymorphus CCALA 037 TaxID=2107692 RepID=A0A2T1FF16_9CYAN|nr:rubredoxin [Chamaesiphon polymorphus]PSB43541.1 rubredoxin [Chamaesiphon polymorphus CCALA 037]